MPYVTVRVVVGVAARVLQCVLPRQRVILKPYPASKASWKRVFDPVYTFLFDLYHQLRTRFVPLIREPGRYALDSSGRG